MDGYLRVKDPWYPTASHGSKEDVLLCGDGGGDVLLVGKVPFLLAPGRDGRAVHARLLVGRDPGSYRQELGIEIIISAFPSAEIF